MSGLLRSWSLTLDGDFLTLLTRLDVESSPQVCWLHTQHGLWLYVREYNVCTTWYIVFECAFILKRRISQEIMLLC